MASNGYNYIYSRLVSDDKDDILGIIAYSIYKRQKIEHIKAFQALNGRAPTEDELLPFHEISNSDVQLNFYSNQAAALAQEFLDVALEEEAKKLDQHYREKSDREIKSYKPKFWTGVWQGVVASIIFVLLLGLLVIFTWSLNQGPRQVIEQIFSVVITDAK